MRTIHRSSLGLALGTTLLLAGIAAAETPPVKPVAATAEPAAAALPAPAPLSLPSQLHDKAVVVAAADPDYARADLA